MKLFHIFILILFISCSNPKEHSYSFYYWRTEWNLDKKEQKTLEKSKSQTIYTRFFDIDKKDGKFTPVGKIHFSEKSSLPLTPVIFITNRTFFGIKKEEIHSLAKNTLSLIENIKNENKLSLTSEIQIDCDWTEQTRERLFPVFRGTKKNFKTKNHLHPSASSSKEQRKNRISARGKGLSNVLCYLFATGKPAQKFNFRCSHTQKLSNEH